MMNIKFDREKMKQHIQEPKCKAFLTEFLSKPEIRELIQNNAFEKLYEITNQSQMGAKDVGTALFLVSDIDFLSHMTEICSGCFHELPITEIAIPSSVTSIGYAAFYSCDRLKSIIVPESVTSIEDAAFAFCKSLNNITISNSVTSIGERAFLGCKSLTNITIPSGVISIGDHTFDECTNLRSITIPSSVKSIGKGAFSVCKSLTSITIPSSVKSIGGYAFYMCTNLKNIIFNGTKAQWDKIKKDKEAIPDNVKVVFKK